MARAREVLADCRFVWHKLEFCADEQEFRVLWFAAAALVRLVGDALDKVDSALGPAMSVAIREAYQTRERDHPLFRDFIKCERDQLIHRYESAVYGGEALGIGVEIDGAVQLEILDDCLFKPLTSGTYEGEDARDVLESAIHWWEIELEWIEMRASEIRAK